MPKFVKLTTTPELPPINEAQELPCGQKNICIANVEGDYRAMENICLHRGGPLGQGMVEGGKVICPWHGWAWDTKTGQSSQSSSTKIEVYPLKIEGGDVLIEI
jgi:nitrite reductase (NADH) small subunit